MDKKKWSAIFEIDVFCTILYGVLSMWTGFLIFLLLFTICILIGFGMAVIEHKPKKREKLRPMGDQHARN